VSAASYYFDSNKNREGYASVGKGLKFAYRYHLGSFGMGPLLIPLAKFIKVVFVYPARLGSRLTGENQIVK